MNKIRRSDVPYFNKLIRAMFDDSFDISEEVGKHDCARVELGTHVDEETAKWLKEYLSDEACPPTVDSLIGTWMLEAERSYSNGLYWDEVSEIVKVEQVTETIIVTKWKPIPDETNSCTPCSVASPCCKE